jgi:hypothetical protein
MKAKSDLRVPVVVYNDLSRADETKLFIDINTKQRPVPNELLLDIRKLAEYQDDVETRLGEVFDLFNELPTSPLSGLLSPSKKISGLLSRVTFNAALKPLLDLFQSAEAEEIYKITGAYFAAVKSGANLRKLPLENHQSSRISRFRRIIPGCGANRTGQAWSKIQFRKF